MNRLVASGGPARAPNHIITVIDATVHDGRVAVLRLEVALIAQAHIARFEHFVVHGTVRRVTHRAALTHHLMLEDEWPGLRGVTFRACGID